MHINMSIKIITRVFLIALRVYSIKKNMTNRFPDIDFEYCSDNIIKTYILLKNREIDDIHLLLSEEECWRVILSSISGKFWYIDSYFK